MVVASKLYGVNATIIIFVFVLYCIVMVEYTSRLVAAESKNSFTLEINFSVSNNFQCLIVNC